MGKVKAIKRCWQCKTPLIKRGRQWVCPKDCGPEALGNLLRFGGR